MQSQAYIFTFHVENNDKDLKCEVADHAVVPKYKSISTTSYTLNWSEEVFVIKKVKNNLP